MHLPGQLELFHKLPVRRTPLSVRPVGRAVVQAVPASAQGTQDSLFSGFGASRLFLGSRLEDTQHSLQWLARQLPFLPDIWKSERSPLTALDADAPRRAQLWTELQGMNSRRLANPSNQQALKSLLAPYQEDFTKVIESLTGQRVHGRPKEPDRILSTIRRRRMTLAGMEDLTRGRIDLPEPDRSRIALILRQLQEGLGRHGYHIQVRFDGTLATSRNPFGAYRGRAHLVIRDRTGFPYELQIGPRPLTTFLETEFTVPGSSLRLNLHDAVFKGVMRLQQDSRAFQYVGQGDRAAGERYLQDTTALYDALMAQAADQRTRFSFQARTRTLQARIGVIHAALRNHPDLLPEGFHPPSAAS